VSADPFTLLGLEPRFSLDAATLEQRHRELSRALHPDKYAQAPAAERRMALSRAIEVNEAARALRDPVKRAEALARRAGIEVGEAVEPKPPATLLMEMMESREALAEATAARDLDAVTKLGEGARARQKRVEAELAAAFEGGDASRVLPLLGELRYLRRFLEEVDAFEESLLA
jgi:molecular chaperone HscB